MEVFGVGRKARIWTQESGECNTHDVDENIFIRQFNSSEVDLSLFGKNVTGRMLVILKWDKIKSRPARYQK